MGKDSLIIVSKNSTLPQELPENLVYWVKCETKVRDETLITDEDL